MRPVTVSADLHDCLHHARKARRDCDFSVSPGPNSCLDGGCNGGLLCDPHTGTGVPPATVAEWTLQGDGNRDFYDGTTSLVTLKA